MTKHCLFVCHPDHGHVIPNLAMVTELARRGHRITYLTAPSMVELVTDAGATAVTYRSRYKDADFTSVANDPGYLLTLLLDESTAMLDAAAELDGDRPDLVVYDTSILYAGRILARKWGVPSVQLIPMFASNPHFSYLNAIYNPEGTTPAAPPEWIGEIMGRIGALAGAHGVDVPPHELWFEVPDFSLVTITRSFQYAGETFDDRFAFVGPCVGDRRFLGEWTPPESDLPVVLISLGAVFNGHPEFFRTCVEAFTGKPWHVVMSVADGFDPAELGPLPPNVEVHRWVPHATVLEHAAVAVTHGGMGTVMEALRAGTPMVVIPTSAIDRPTGLRIAELKLGTTMPPEQVTAELLVEHVHAVATDAGIAENVQRAKQDVQDAGGAPRAADEMEKYLARVR